LNIDECIFLVTPTETFSTPNNRKNFLTMQKYKTEKNENISNKHVSDMDEGSFWYNMLDTSIYINL